MKIKQIIFIIVTFSIIPVQSSQAANNIGNDMQKDFALKIHLPRNITIEDDSLKLGRVGIILGEESLVTKAGEIMLGRFSTPGQKIVLDRTAILSILACNGIDTRQVSLTGAEKTTVRQKHKIIKSSEFVNLAREFLQKNPSSGSLCRIEPLRAPKDLLLPILDKDVTLSPCLIENGTVNQSKVRISVLADSNEMGACEVTFSLKFNCRTAVAQVEIPAGAVIGHDNTRIEQTVSDYPEPVNWSPPYGLIARRTLPENTVIQPNMTGPAKPSIIIERNETVVIRIEMPGLLVTATGKAMQQGNNGECIKVRNTDSQRIILAKINEDGTVEPVL